MTFRRSATSAESILALVKHFAVGLLIVASLIGCGSDPDVSDGDGDADGDTPDAATDGDVTPSDWATLVGRSWTIQPGSADTYKCSRIRVEADMWVAGYRAIAPVGTHHTVVTISDRGSPVGEYDCSAGNLDFQMLYASGVATDDLLFPDGVAMKVRAGQFINLNLHLFNATDDPIAGTSSILVKTIPADQVVHQADMVFAGTQSLSVPSDGQPHDVLGGCTTPSDWNVFTLWPHMHQFATHQKFVVTEQGGAPETLLDYAYDFEDQKNYPQVSRLIPGGSRIDVTCTYVNNSGTTLTFGDSSNQEMCFTGMYKWPAGGHLFQCAL